VKPLNVAEKLLGSALPTNAWWQNLLLEGNAPVIPNPYSMAVTSQGVQFCYSERLLAMTNISLIGGWVPDITVSLAGGFSGSPVVTGYDDLSATVEIPGEIRVPIVRGNPFPAVEIKKGYPIIKTLIQIKSLEIPEGISVSDGSTVYQILLGNGQNWLLYARPALQLEWINGTMLRANPNGEPFSGVLRLGMLTCGVATIPWLPGRIPACDAEVVSKLLPHLHRYPVGGTFSYAVSGDSAEISYELETRGDDVGDGGLVMMMMPHHLLMLDNPVQAKALRNVTLIGGGWQTILNYWTVRGPLTPFFTTDDQPVFKLTLDLPKIEFYPPSNLNGDAASFVLKTLKADVERPFGGGKVPDTYHYGKALARIARLALIANDMGQEALMQKAVKKVQDAFESWFGGESPSNKLVYDTTWGGLVVQKGLAQPIFDYGNAYYNDHHFHYGYMIYALAVWFHLSPETAIQSMDGKLVNYARALVSDIAHPNTTEQWSKLRHKDFYEGHSWASGLFKMMDGREQESCSEAVNAYYAVSLLGQVLGDADMENLGRVMTAMEVQSARTYWQIPGLAFEVDPNLFPGGFYPPTFSNNAMIGVMGANMASHSTWFGTQVEFVHGIQMIPFTPITDALLPRSFVIKEFGQVAQAFIRKKPAIMTSWAGYVHMAQAIIDPRGSWDALMPMNASGFDDGNSMTAALYWAATRPDSEKIFSNAANAAGSTKAASSSSSSSSSSKAATESYFN